MNHLDANGLAVHGLFEEFLSCRDLAVADEMLAPGFADDKPSTPGLSGRDILPTR